ncbi:MAG TPA: hypothetical protein VFY16_12520 [Gemmatimonadaceae bacterium]|nr:hypothetical protein [Gemmatimonadaceae bacterium]
MTVKLNDSAYDHAKRLIDEGSFVPDERDAWSEDQLPVEKENAYLHQHGYQEYGRWYLGVDPAQPEETKARYSFPYGDFRSVHRCGVLAAETRAGQYRYADIEQAAAHLHGMIDALAHAKGATR